MTKPMPHALRIYSAQFSPDGTRVVTASDDSSARIWDALTGEPLIEPMKHDSAVLSAQFSADRKLIVTASVGRTALIWDARTGRSRFS